VEEQRIHDKNLLVIAWRIVVLAARRDHPPDVASKGSGHLGRLELTSEGRLLAGVLVAFVAVALLAALDITSDLRAGTTFGHVVTESGILAAGLLGAVLMTRRLALVVRGARAAAAEALALSARLEASEAEARRWRAEARQLVRGLGAAIDRQFERWALSPAEKEVGLLLLKGLSHKEIAEVRSITEATARQQARAIYRKAGLSGRNDLAAFFLEELLLPGSDASPAG
jgi:DNA-binding CsgD family transcriptional regulator